MELTILLAPLLAALIASPLAARLGERGASISALVLGVLAAVLSWALVTSDGAGEPVFLASWINSGTLTAELSLVAEAPARLIAALMLTIVALAQLMGVTVTTPKALRKVGDSRAMRLQSTLSLVSFAALLVIFAGGMVMLSAGLMVLAGALTLALDFNLRSVEAGRAAARALLIVVLASLLVLGGGALMFEAADAEVFDVLAPLAETLDLAQPLTLAFGLGVLALAGALPFLPWSVTAKEAPASIATALAVVPPLVAVALLTRAAPYLEAEPVALHALLLATAVLGPLLALTRAEPGGAVTAAGLASVALALQAALMGNIAAALVLLAAHGLGLLILQASYEQGPRGITRLAALAGTLSATGIGLPVVLGPIQVALLGHVGQGAALSAVEGQTWLLWGYGAALALQALVLWKLYFTTFHARRKKPVEAEAEAEAPIALPTRVALGVMVAALLIAGIIAGPGLDQAAPALPLFAGLIGAVVAAAIVFIPPLGEGLSRAAEPLSPLFTGPLFLPAIYRGALGTPARAAGSFVASRLDTSLLDAVFDPVAARILPGLTRQAGQAQRSRAFPFVLGAIVAGALIVTLITMAGS